MFINNLSGLFGGLAICTILFSACSNTKAQQDGSVKSPSDPVALALVKDLLDSFGNDVYHCKWEYDAERLQDTNFENGTKKLHIEGEWSFSAKLGSSYKIRCGDVEYIIREIEEGKVLAFWPEVTDQGQKFRMNLSPFYNAFRGDIGGVRGMLYPCELRSYLLKDKWGSSSVFGLKSTDSDKTVISIEPLRKDMSQLLTLQTNDGNQALGSKWAISEDNPNMYRMYRGAEYEKVYLNTRVNNAWLPAEVTYKRIQEGGLLGGKSVFETAKWKVIGQYTVNKDTSMFKNIVPPDGTLFYDESTYKTQRIGIWKRDEKIGEGTQDNALVKQILESPDTPVKSTAHWYPTGNSNRYYAVAATLLLVGFVFVVIKTKGFGLKKQA